MPIGVMLRMVCGRFAGVETWYLRSASDVAVGVPIATEMATARSKCLASNAYLEGARVFNTAVKYDVRNVSFQGAGGNAVLGIVGQLPPAQPNLADIQSTSLLVRVIGNAGGRARSGNRELFAVPDNVVETSAQGNRVYVPTVAFLGGFGLWQAYVLANLNFRVLTISTRHTIAGLVVDSAPPGLLGLRVDLAGDPLIATGKKVRIRGAVRQSTLDRLNGLWTVSRIDAPVAPSTLSTVYLLNSVGSDPNGYDPLGTVEGIDYAYCVAGGYDVVRPMGRKRGGRSGLSRGRSLARSR